jgi:large repetitive protein
LGVSFYCQLDGNAVGACASPQTYSGVSEGNHTFSVMAQDAAGNQSPAATFAWTVDTTVPPAPTITSTPANPTNQTSASFSFVDIEAGVTFLCQLDSNAASTCASPQTYSGLSQGSHTFSVRAQDPAGNQSAAATFAWIVDTTAPAPTITSTPTNPTNQTSASFSFTDTEAGVSFLCNLDGSAFTACSSPQTYSGLSEGSHTFSVKVQDSVGNQSSATSFSWIIDTTPPPTPTITSYPGNLVKQTTAIFKFIDAEPGVSFLCQLDGSGFSNCSSPENYNKLSSGGHTFSVKAVDNAGNQSGAASFTWTIR